jgi:hypothetical protein
MKGRPIDGAVSPRHKSFKVAHHGDDAGYRGLWCREAAFMSGDGLVTASEIARLAEVGRAAVSNWRRRFDDFPEPSGGTAASPMF